MKDFTNNTLKIGDTVAYISPYYRELDKGTILRFTRTQIVISPIYEDGDSGLDVRRDPKTVVKIN